MGDYGGRSDGDEQVNDGDVLSNLTKDYYEHVAKRQNLSGIYLSIRDRM